MGSKMFVEVTIVRHGQPRPYADHEYVYDFRFTQQHTGSNEHSILLRTKKQALSVAQGFCPFVETTDPTYNWSSRTLQSFEPIPNATYQGPRYEGDEATSDAWRIIVKAAFTD